jgi:tetratricopeptide (TPR) repeat protein
MKRPLRYFVLALFATASLVAQRGGGAGTTGGTTTGSTSGTGNNTGNNPGNGGITNIPSQQPQSNGQQMDPGNQMPIFLSGRVMMDDGTPPATSISIQRVCSGSPHTMAYTNPKGQFSFQWGAPTGIVPDASEVSSGFGGMRGADDITPNSMRNGQMGGGSMGMSMLGCELIANAPGFRSERVNLSTHRASDNPDVGNIVLHRIAAVEGTSVSATAINAPKDARKAWEKGSQLLHKNKPADAEKELQRAVDLYPKYANAWLDLGRARLQQKATDPAREAFLKAIEADPKLVDPYVELGELAANQQNWPDATKYLDRALQLDPVDYPRLWFEDAVADYNMKNYDRAEKNAREALRLAPQFRDPRANQLLGLILINKRDYAGAGAALRTYMQVAPKAKDLDQVKMQLQQIESRLAATTPEP